VTPCGFVNKRLSDPDCGGSRFPQTIDDNLKTLRNIPEEQIPLFVVWKLGLLYEASTRLILGAARIFVRKREGVTGEWRQILSEGLRNLCSYPDRLSLG
jgi:hypothetical protein